MTERERRYKLKEGEVNYSGYAVRLKRQLDDIIDVAFRNESKLKDMKRFYLYCTSKTSKTKLGDCRYDLKTGTSSIRMMAFNGEYAEEWQDNIILAIHEVCHHIQCVLTGTTGHDQGFYDIHKKMLFASFDMGILTISAVTNCTSHGRNKYKLARMMDEYVPHPIPYKQSTSTITVFNAFQYRMLLKSRSYAWNDVDQSWVKEIPTSMVDGEKIFLIDAGLDEENIVILPGAAVVSSQVKYVRLYGVPYSKKDVPASLGYRWDSNGACWVKKIRGKDISTQERVLLSNASTEISIRIQNR